METTCSWNLGKSIPIVLGNNPSPLTFRKCTAFVNGYVIRLAAFDLILGIIRSGMMGVSLVVKIKLSFIQVRVVNSIFDLNWRTFMVTFNWLSLRL